MNSSQSKDDWVKAQQHKFHKPIDVDTLMWVRNRLMRLEVAFAGGSVATVIPSDLLQLLASVGFLVIGGRLLVPLVRDGEANSDGDQTSES